MPIPKHEPTKRTKATKKTAATPPVADSAPFVDMAGVETALEKIAHSLTSYNVNACDGNFTYLVELFTGKNTYPVSVQLTGGEATEALHGIASALDNLEHLERIAIAFERIATALEAK